jgi:hypothetical protein
MSEIKLAKITFQRDAEGNIIRDRDGYLVAEEIVLYEGDFNELRQRAELEAERQKKLREKRKGK